MKCYRVILECFTGAKTTTYVGAESPNSVAKIAENRINSRSPMGWKVISITETNVPVVNN